MAQSKRTLTKSQTKTKDLDEIDLSNRQNMSRSESSELKLLLQALLSVKRGDFSVRLPDTLTGIHGKLADTFN
jgi:hypothetical protein